MRYIIERTRDVGKKEQSTSQTVRTIAYEGDRSAHEWRVMLTSDGAPVTLAGYDIAAYFKLPDTQGEAIRVQGVLNGSVASVVLAPECYAKSGRVQARMIASRADRQLTIDAIALDVEDFAVSAVVDLTGTLLDTEEMIAAISAMKAATADARAVVDVACPAIVPTQAGDVIALSDSADRPIRGLTIYGRTTQDGTPSPEAPVKLESVGAEGSIEVAVADKISPIVITAQPADPISVQGDTAIFRVRAKGEYLKYQWMYSTNNGVSYAPSTQPGNDTPEMTMTIREYHNGYPYYCEITDAYGNTVRTKIVSVSVTETPAIILRTQPADVVAPVGRIATFSVDAEGTGLAYQWQWQDNQGGTWANSSQTGNNTPVFSMPVESHRNGYKYRCVITDANGNTVMTDTATLTIGDVTEVDTARAIVNTPNGLQGVPVTSGGNYIDANGQMWIADTVEYDAETGAAKHIKRVHLERITSTSNSWSQSSSVNGRFVINRPRPMPVEGVAPMCNRFQGKISTSDRSVGVAYAWTSDQMCFDTPFATIDEWKAYLDANEVYLAYVMAEPIVTALSAEEVAALASLRACYPSTTIYNARSAHMAVSYVADTKNYIDQKIAAIAAATIGG